MNKIIGRSLILWVSILPLAVANGALREYLLVGLVGRAAHPVSGIILCAVIFLVTFRFLPRLGAGEKKTYIKMGLVWVLCTVIFETLLGLLSGDTLSTILHNYNPLTGNLWLLVVLFIGLVPWLAAKRNRMI